MNIIKMISKCNYSSRNGNTIKYIVLHYTGNKGDTAKNNAIYFGGGNRNASAHYFVDDNEIVQVVEEHNASWAVGDGKGQYGITNSNSLSIEMCCNSSGQVSEKTENKTIELVKSLMNKYNISIANVVRHYDASRKTCPNWSANNWSRWHNFKAKLQGGIPSNPTINKPLASIPANPYKKYADFVGDRCKELQSLLIKLGYSCGGYGADGLFGKGTYDSLIQFQKDNGLAVDGLAGVATFAKLNELISKKNASNGNDWIRRLQQECNAQGFSNQVVDGIAGVNTLNGCPTLRKGSQGNITKLLQEKLVKLGYSTNGVDGIFGNGTYLAVIKFQKSQGLSVDGIVGKNTWRKLLNL